MIRRTLAVVLLAAGCAGAGTGSVGPAGGPPPGPAADWSPSAPSRKGGLTLFDRDFPANSAILLVAKAVTDSDAALAARCEAALTGGLKDSGLRVFDPETLARVRERIRVEERLKGKSPAEVAAILSELNAAALVLVWVDAASGDSFRGAFRGDAVISLTASDGKGERFGSWTSPPFDDRNPWPVRESEQDARLAAIDSQLGVVARQLGIGREKASVGDGPAVSLGAPVAGPRVENCLAVGIDEARGEALAGTSAGILSFDLATLSPGPSLALPAKAEWMQFCIPRRAAFCGSGRTLSVLSLEGGAVLRTVEASSRILCAHVTESGDACLGLEGGAVAVLPWEKDLVEGGRGQSRSLRAVALSAAEGSVAEVSEPEKGETEIAVRGHDLLRRGAPVRVQGEGMMGAPELITPTSVAMGRSGEIVVVACRRTVRELRRGRQTIDGLIIVLNGGSGQIVKKLQGDEFAEVAGMDIHPASSRFLALGTEDARAGGGILSIIDAMTGAVLDSTRIAGARRLAFSSTSGPGTPRGRFLCLLDSGERISVYPLGTR